MTYCGSYSLWTLPSQDNKEHSGETVVPLQKFKPAILEFEFVKIDIGTPNDYLCGRSLN
jgi:hypothetical protein